jgi:choline dehydrogenase-like flavoprotein
MTEHYDVIIAGGGAGEDTLAHTLVGTCQFGAGSATSVLDVNCKAHELDNRRVGEHLPGRM